MQNLKKENKIDKQTKYREREKEGDFSWKKTNKKWSFETMKKCTNSF
jgi:hypothetical protein